jgi:hypothetical protein
MNDDPPSDRADLIRRIIAAGPTRDPSARGDACQHYKDLFCRVCGTRFTSARRDTKFCSPVCRRRHWLKERRR